MLLSWLLQTAPAVVEAWLFTNNELVIVFDAAAAATWIAPATVAELLVKLDESITPLVPSQ